MFKDLVFLAIIFAVVGTIYNAEAYDTCRDDETGEIIIVDGPCPTGTHPTGGWVE
jgi:hypothetical protein